MKRLYRSRTDSMIAGVCGGLAEYINIDPTIVRLIFMILLLMGTGGFWIYIILWAIVPFPPEHVNSSIEVTEVQEARQTEPSSESEEK